MSIDFVSNRLIAVEYLGVYTSHTAGDWTREVRQTSVFPGDSSWGYVDCTSYQCGKIHDGVNPELSSAVYEEIGEDVGIFRDEGNLFPPASLLCGLI